MKRRLRSIVRKKGRIRVRKLGSVRPVLVVPTALAGELADPCHFSDVAQRPFFAYGRLGDAFFDAVSDFVEQHGGRKHSRLLVPDIRTLKVLVAGGGGVSILPDYTTREQGLAQRRLHGLSFSQPLWVAIRSATAEVPAIAALVKDLLAFRFDGGES